MQGLGTDCCSICIRKQYLAKRSIGPKTLAERDGPLRFAKCPKDYGVQLRPWNLTFLPDTDAGLK